MNSQIVLEADFLTAFILNTVIISLAQKYPLLTRSGWIHAGILGTILWGCLGFRGWLAVAFYLLVGTLVTRLGMANKQSRGLAEGRGGRRGPENVWGSAATGTIFSLLFKLRVGSPQLLLIGFAASFTAKLADTFGSEIGKRWGRKTFLITNFTPVPVGTDGAISLLGTIASFLGSLIMTFVFLLFGLITTIKSFLVILIVGFLATLFESYIGAYFQSKSRFLTNEVINFLQTLFSAFAAILIYQIV